MGKEIAMNRIATVARGSMDDLLERLGTRLGVDSSTVVPFTDHTDLLTSLLKFVADNQTRVLVAGHASPDIAIAADRADLEAVEVRGVSPFVSHPEDIVEAVDSTRNIIYLANPNWVTGSNYSLPHLDLIARSVGDGCLIIDERYFDYYGITGLPLLDRHDHVVVIRSLTAGFGIGSDQSGCIAGSPSFVNSFKESFEWSRLSTTLYRLLNVSLDSDRAAARRLIELHDEALRIATALTELGVQNRITATDFLLLRVADPIRVGNNLAGFGCPVENLEGYPDLENYVRYRIQSPLSNDNFLTAFRRMPKDYYHMKDIDRRAVMFHRPQEASTASRRTLPRRVAAEV
jgi:histidinol-phosphate/aromatic aminotransferase/cobyric acid decarboxylase-like protein